MAKITITGLRKTKIYSFSAEDCEGGKHAVTDYETDVPPSWLPLTPERIAALRIKDLARPGGTGPSKVS